MQAAVLNAPTPVRLAGYQGAASILSASLHELARGLAAAGDDFDVQVQDDVTAAGEKAGRSTGEGGNREAHAIDRDAFAKFQIVITGIDIALQGGTLVLGHGDGADAVNYSCEHLKRLPRNEG